MRHKGERSIPDFSHHRKAPPGAAPAEPTRKGAKPAPDRLRQPVAKPQATSAKSGRRGQ